MARSNQRGLRLSFKRCGKGSRGRWFKTIGGKPVYFRWGNGLRDRISFEFALSAYEGYQLEQAAARAAQAQQQRAEADARAQASLSGQTALNEWLKSILRRRERIINNGWTRFQQSRWRS